MAQIYMTPYDARQSLSTADCYRACGTSEWLLPLALRRLFVGDGLGANRTVPSVRGNKAFAWLKRLACCNLLRIESAIVCHDGTSGTAPHVSQGDLAIDAHEPA
jgi:hypothetical protein